MTNLLVNYKNGDYDVQIYNDGTKIRTTEIDNPKALFPESIDVKITNYCDMGCKYCHEMSTEEGNHGDLNKLLEVLETLPRGIELAIGGGNPLAHPDLDAFLTKASEKGFICNLTVNQGHLQRYINKLEELIKNQLVYGIGISIINNNYKYVHKLMDMSDNVVLHVIAGVNPVSIIETFQDWDRPLKVLVLGYKDFGFGIGYRDEKVNEQLEMWSIMIGNYLRDNIVLCFDNLALDQLDVKRFFTLYDGTVLSGWTDNYMGDDFTHSMYIDAIEGKYAPTSRSLDRVDFDEISLMDYFQQNSFQ